MIELLNEYIVTIVIFMPALWALILMLLPAGAENAVRRNAMTGALVTLVAALTMMTMHFEERSADGEQFASQAGEFTLETRVSWIGGDVGSGLQAIDVSYHVGVDGISLWLIMLTALLTPLVLWGSFSGIRQRVKEYYALMLLLESSYRTRSSRGERS